MAALRFLSLCVLALSLTALAFFRTDPMTRDNPGFSQPGDHYAYIAMAESDRLEYPEAPFNRRVLTPALVKALPFDTETGFRALTFFCLSVTGVALYYALRQLGLSGALSLAGMLSFFSLSFATEFVLFDFWLTDPLAFFLLAFSFWAAASRRLAWFAGLLFVGALNKEAAIFALALFYGLEARRLFDLEALKRAALLGVPAMLALLALRLSIPSESVYSYLDLLATLGRQRLEGLTVTTLLGPLTFWAFGIGGCVLPLFALVGEQGRRLALRFLPFVMLVYSQLLFAVNNERLLVFGFPVVAVLSAFGLREIARLASVEQRLLVPLPLLMLAANLWAYGYKEALKYQAPLFLLYLVATFVGGHFVRKRCRLATADGAEGCGNI